MWSEVVMGRFRDDTTITATAPELALQAARLELWVDEANLVARLWTNYTTPQSLLIQRPQNLELQYAKASSFKPNTGFHAS